MKLFTVLFFTALFFIGCNSSHEKKVDIDNPILTKLYSSAAKDTFSVFIQLPAGYDQKNKTKYPVVYLLDANLYFDIMAATFKKYSEAGLLAPAILVGIGYKDFRTMDSLRSRDLTFPLAIPEYEMATSGQADKFLSFIKNDLVKYVDANYATLQSNRILMGHSLGGYFTMYALNQSLINKETIFTSYIAASPSLDYNHNYLLNEFEVLHAESRIPVKTYITFGGFEDMEEGESPDSTGISTSQQLMWLTGTLKRVKDVHCRGDVYSNLGHMDTPLPSFVRGLQWALNMTE